MVYDFLLWFVEMYLLLMLVVDLLLNLLFLTFFTDNKQVQLAETEVIAG